MNSYINMHIAYHNENNCIKVNMYLKLKGVLSCVTTKTRRSLSNCKSKHTNKFRNFSVGPFNHLFTAGNLIQLRIFFVFREFLNFWNYLCPVLATTVSESCRIQFNNAGKKKFCNGRLALNKKKLSHKCAVGGVTSPPPLSWSKMDRKWITINFSQI